MKKIIGLGSPIIDEIAFVDDLFLDEHSQALREVWNSLMSQS